MVSGARALLDEAAADRQHGSAAVAATAARALRALADEAGEPEAFRRDLDAACLTLVREQARLAAVWRVVNDCLLAADRSERGQAVHTVGAAATSCLERAGRAQEDITDTLDRVLPDTATILTCSSSSTLERAFLDLGGRGHIDRILCCRSLPGAEGEALARRLTAGGVEAEVVEDAAMGPAAALADSILFGADLVAPDVIVNKVGSRPLALVAAATGRPALVVSDSSKVLPGRLAEAVRRAQVADPEGLFEAIPWGEVGGWLSERGLATSADAAATAAAVPVASLLRTACVQR